ncbi:MAG TPA: 8-amino-7-oxononanoate synthase, partial [Anseongella sp.]|nr:8-amino-7-oxononanoate synthase [Anseongella sp.]
IFTSYICRTLDSVHRHLDQKLKERLSEDRYRRLPRAQGLADFCSNDYLGLARSEELKENLRKELSLHSIYPVGSTGSRLISGNSAYACQLEEEIALFHHAAAGLLFNSGYLANLALFSTVPQRGDVVICDEYIHASVIDGVRLSWATRYNFRHNDPGSLEEKLRLARKIMGQTEKTTILAERTGEISRSGAAGRNSIFIAAESLYSMDGDHAPLRELAELAEEYDARLIVDEAHAGGIYGKNGRGLVPHHGLEERVFARVYTFGKALGTHGAIVLGSKMLKDYLVNFARPFIYTTALPFHDLAAVKCAYEMLAEHPRLQQELQEKTSLFARLAGRHPRIRPRPGPLQTVAVPGNKAAKAASDALRQKGFDVRAILSPTVPEGSERLRICLHLYNTEEEISALVAALETL